MMDIMWCQHNLIISEILSIELYELGTESTFDYMQNVLICDLIIKVGLNVITLIGIAGTLTFCGYKAKLLLSGWIIKRSHCIHTFDDQKRGQSDGGGHKWFGCFDRNVIKIVVSVKILNNMRTFVLFVQFSEHCMTQTIQIKSMTPSPIHTSITIVERLGPTVRWIVKNNFKKIV